LPKKPGTVALGGIRARLHAGAQSVVEMAPMIGADGSGIDVQRFHRRDRGEHARNLWPAAYREQKSIPLVGN
jgi:hypothetical protein